MILYLDINANSFVKQLRDAKKDLPVFMPLSNALLLNEEVLPTDSLENIFFTKEKDSKRSEEFNRRYKERFGVEPAAISGATTYDMTTLVLKAIGEGAKNTEGVIEYLKNVKEYEGYLNKIQFGLDGHVMFGEVEIRKVKDLFNKVVN